MRPTRKRTKSSSKDIFEIRNGPDKSMQPTHHTRGRFCLLPFRSLNIVVVILRYFSDNGGWGDGSLKG
jgi:hypothetical protein